MTRLLSYLLENSSELQNYGPRVPLISFTGGGDDQVDKDKAQTGGKVGDLSLEYSQNYVLRLKCAFYQALMLLVHWCSEHTIKHTVSTQ